jgi:site-specific recombinase XerC
MTALAPTLQAFFTERLINQRRVSQHTLLAYRDAVRLLLRFVQARTGKPPRMVHQQRVSWENMNPDVAVPEPRRLDAS